MKDGTRVGKAPRSPREVLAWGAIGGLLTGGALVGVGATLNSQGTSLAAPSRPAAAPQLTMHDVSIAAHQEELECLRVTDAGSTTSIVGNVVTRRFLGGTSCQVVFHDGKLSEVSVHQGNWISPNEGATTYSMRYQDKRQTADGSNTSSWDFQTASAPDTGNENGVKVEGKVWSDGSSQAWAVGSYVTNFGFDAPSDSSIEIDGLGTGVGVDNVLPVFSAMSGNMRIALKEAQRPKGGY